MSKTIEHFFKPVGGNDSSSSKAIHTAAVLAAQKETEQAFAKISYREHFHAYGNYIAKHVLLGMYIVSMVCTAGSISGYMHAVAPFFCWIRLGAPSPKASTINNSRSERVRFDCALLWHSL